MLEGVTWRHEQRSRASIAESLRLAGFIRTAKKLPTLESLFADHDRARAGAPVHGYAQTPKEIAAVVRMWQAKYGGTLTNLKGEPIV